MYLYFFFISLSLVGYGFLVSKLLNIKNSSIGINGILGITFTCIFSFLTSLFLSHSKFFNLSFWIIGLIFIFIFSKNIKNSKREIISSLIIFFILIIFITVGKNHDDFPYYHFPYTIFLTEFSHPIGFGQFNNGFRSPSSIFFLSSMFYLPGIGVYLFHISSALILGFSNLILINFIFSKKFFNESKYINFLSLICFVFINIFFYRLAEHGTDRSGMILTIICLILLIYLINCKQNYENLDFMKFLIIVICFVSTIKPFYLINLPILFLFLFYQNTINFFLKLFFSKTFFYCILLLTLTIFFTFINSGCLVYPATFLCFENFSWSFSKQEIDQVNIWFELWSKGGASPNYIVENRLDYIANFNWLANWIEIYFFNKVSDYLVGLFVLISVIFLSFYKKDKNEIYNVKFFSVYLFIFLLLCEWFLKHPSLRYGGYHLIALMIFIPLSLYLSKFKFFFQDYTKRAFLIITIALLIFILRNGIRLNDEFVKYNYNPLINTNYKFIGGDKNFHLRYNKHFKRFETEYPWFNFLGKKIYITTLNN